MGEKNINLSNLTDFKNFLYDDKGKASGFATLNEEGKVPNEQLPSVGYNIDDKLNNTSENPVQNKVITKALNDKLNSSDISAWAKAKTKPEYTADEVGADKAGSASTALNNANTYTDNKVDALSTAMGTKADQSDLTSHVNNKDNPHTVTKSQVGLGNVPNVTTNDQTPTYSDVSTLETLTSGEKISVAFGKIKLAISNLISHIGNKSNPHGVTKTQVGLSNVDNTADANKNVLSATKLSSAKNLGVNLTSTTAVTFDGSANVTNIPVSGILPVTNGGTGRTDGNANGIIGSVASLANKTITDLRNELDKLLAISGSSTVISTAAYDMGSWIDLWNAEDKTTKLVAGARWTFTVIGSYSANTYGMILCSTYGTSYLIPKSNGMWGKVYQITTTNDTPTAVTSSKAGLMSAADKTKLDTITDSADAVSFTQTLKSGTAVGTININGTDITIYAPTNTNTAKASSTASIGSASAWSAGTLPTLGTAIAADDITSWSAGTAATASVSKGVLTITNGTTPTLAYTTRSIPNVTGVGSLPSLTVTNTTVVTGVST